ncbi:acyl carrier protein 4, chloroplastic [Corchorus olitorius]|uniref:Acyl carrier protein 4, chloroplastic n=1 Tax=Corchorus olitorius TaxID=93759 RepID=A0A1R3GAU6_9ROSI|nr:acyl carrier protein 4, chloroplastic [Corchorus olitorius]
MAMEPFIKARAPNIVQFPGCHSSSSIGAPGIGSRARALPSLRRLHGSSES